MGIFALEEKISAIKHEILSGQLKALSAPRTLSAFQKERDRYETT